MSIILSIETATNSGSVAVHKSGQLIGLQQYNIEKSHSSLLHVIIRQLMENVGIEMSELDAIAISAGPGSYTGLRIGVSTAKGLCYALDKPLLAINTLESMARQVVNITTEEVLLCPMIDARRLEVYCMMITGQMEIIEETKAEIVNEDSFFAYLREKKVLFFGDGSSKCKPILTHENAAFIGNIIPSAKEIGELAYARYEKGEFENLAYYEPFYLKEFRIIKSKKKQF
ncbi:tRNA (adenosine(37)-N6)-threonylcarbamoyltransferase complex dimerization subunit type 1 TsaB [Reichenbachiella sp. MALMAid0571]|uniref:tRNA (adenosine(37)-N6)-threonylcarbamoyltransferase complex dimerization subunit type 1 TsaB n=1 Tax=Reichenbachiella sp. MALMAid0571 TaxID=3143939 RepID=UPI0032DE5578